MYLQLKMSDRRGTLPICLAALLLLLPLSHAFTAALGAPGATLGPGGSAGSAKEAAAGVGDSAWRCPSYCGRLDCPRFTIWQKHMDFEMSCGAVSEELYLCNMKTAFCTLLLQVREYEPAAWVAANVSQWNYERAVQAAGQVGRRRCCTSWV